MTKKYSTQEIKQMIVAEAQKQGVPIELALAVAKHESGFNNLAKSKQNTDGSRDHGVFQLNDKYHKLKNVYDPNENIAYGIKHLKGLLAGAKGDIRKALSDYNAGANATGKGRKQGDAYAQKVMALMKNDNINGQVTGAAAPVPTSNTDNANVANNMADLYESQISDAEKLIKRYFTDKGYNDSYFKKIKKESDEEIEKARKALDKIDMEASPEKVEEITNRFNEAKAKYDEKMNLAIKAAEEGVPLDKINSYVNMFKSATNENIKRMQEANPYTRMAQEAPLQAQDEKLMNQRFAVQDTMNVMRSALGLEGSAPDYAALENQRNQIRQANEMARRTGLTPEQFLAGAQADYNTMGGALNNQQQVIAQLYNMAVQGDINAKNTLISLLGNQANAEMTTAQNMQSALNTADNDAFNRAQLQAQNELALLGRQQNLYGYPLQADASMQANTQNQVGATLRQGMTGGNTAAGQYLNYQGMLQRADAAGQPEAQDPYKALKDFDTMRLNALGMSANVTPEMLGQAIDETRAHFAQARPEAYNILYPNAPTPVQPIQGNYTQFNPITQQNYMRQPQQGQ